MGLFFDWLLLVESRGSNDIVLFADETTMFTSKTEKKENMVDGNKRLGEWFSANKK